MAYIDLSKKRKKENPVSSFHHVLIPAVQISKQKLFNPS